MLHVEVRACLQGHNELRYIMTRKLDKYQVVNAKKPDLYPAGIVVVECLNKRRVIIKF